MNYCFKIQFNLSSIKTQLKTWFQVICCSRITINRISNYYYVLFSQWKIFIIELSQFTILSNSISGHQKISWECVHKGVFVSVVGWFECPPQVAKQMSWQANQSLWPWHQTINISRFTGEVLCINTVGFLICLLVTQCKFIDL